MTTELCSIRIDIPDGEVADHRDLPRRIRWPACRATSPGREPPRT